VGRVERFLCKNTKKFLGGLKDRKVVGLIWTELIIVALVNEGMIFSHAEAQRRGE